MFNLARSMTPSRNTRSYTLRTVPSSPGRSFLTKWAKWNVFGNKRKDQSKQQTSDVEEKDYGPCFGNARDDEGASWSRRGCRTNIWKLQRFNFSLYWLSSLPSASAASPSLSSRSMLTKQSKDHERDGCSLTLLLRSKNEIKWDIESTFSSQMPPNP